MVKRTVRNLTVDYEWESWLRTCEAVLPLDEMATLFNNWARQGKTIDTQLALLKQNHNINIGWVFPGFLSAPAVHNHFFGGRKTKFRSLRKELEISTAARSRQQPDEVSRQQVMDMARLGVDPAFVRTEGSAGVGIEWVRNRLRQQLGIVMSKWVLALPTAAYVQHLGTRLMVRETKQKSGSGNLARGGQWRDESASSRK